MKIVRYSFDNKISYGVLQEQTIVPFRYDPFSSMEMTDEKIPLNQIKLLHPTTPSKILAVGLNYAKHAKELGLELPKTPIIFLKPPSSSLSPLENIIIPKQSDRVDYETELAIVIGKQCKDIKQNDANNVIFGYTCFNDVTARDIQNQDGQWTRGKSYDTFAPFGPHIETQFNWKNKAVRAYLNDQLVQNGSTDDFIFDIGMVIEFVSQVMTLYPGDIITTGTPSGIGPMKHGDVIKIDVEGIGILQNTVIDPYQ